MYIVKETARKILCLTESDEMNMKRTTRYLKGVPSARCLIEIVTCPQSVNVFTDRDWEEYKWWSCGVGERHIYCMVTNTTVSELEFRRSRTLYLDNWNCQRGDGDEISLERTGIRSDSRAPRRQSICEGVGSQTRVRTDDRARCRKQTTLACVNTKSNKADLMTKCDLSEAHMKGCAVLGLKPSRDDGKTRLKPLEVM